MLCLLALIVFAGLAVVSTRYPPLAREALACVFRRVTLRKCTTGFARLVAPSEEELEAAVRYALGRVHE